MLISVRKFILLPLLLELERVPDPARRLEDSIHLVISIRLVVSLYQYMRLAKLEKNYGTIEQN